MFHYAITRPYPYRWFTPVAIAGGILLLILLSLMNFVQNSYILAVEYDNNPNSTITKGVWFKNWPSYLANSVEPVCQPANLPINTEFFTNHTALTYTITSVFEGEGESSPASPSLPYLNNVLENCNVSTIEMQFDGSYSQSWAAYSASTWNIDMRAFATCMIHGPMGRTVFNLTAHYNPITGTGDVPGTSRLISRNAISKASNYWAEALLSAYWIDTVSTVWNESVGLSDKGVVWLYPHNTLHNIDSLSFFNLTYNFHNMNTDVGQYIHNENKTTQYLIQNTTGSPPQIWREVDRLGKVMYSTVMMDLGSAKAQGGNLLNDEQLLQHYTSNFTWIAENSNVYRPTFAPLQKLDYETMKRDGKTGPLEFNSSVISTKYLCQVPKLKSAGDILMSVLLADLVFLSLAWKLFTLGVDHFGLNKQPTANYCEGSVRGDDDGIRLLPGVSPQPSQNFRLTLPASYLPVASTPDGHESAIGDDRPESVPRWKTA